MISQDSCIKIEYDGYIGDSDALFDTTDEEKAKKQGIFNGKIRYGPISIVVGRGFVIRGLDESFVGRKKGESFSVSVPPEKAFGRKNGKLLRLIPTRYFRKNNINPVSGMQVIIDNVPGIVKTVSPGRVIVDFNHPLAGKTLRYKVKIIDEIKEPSEIVKAIVGFFINSDDVDVEIKDSEILIKTKLNLPLNIKASIDRLVKEILKKEYKISFIKPD